jgi:hypothetical protein
MVVHSGIEASFAIACHGMGGHGNDGKIMESSMGANQPGRCTEKQGGSPPVAPKMMLLPDGEVYSSSTL